MFVEDESEDKDIDEEKADEEEDDEAQQKYDDTDTLEETDEINGYEYEDEGNDNFDVELEASMEIADNSAEEKNDDIFEGFADIPGIHEIDNNSAEPLEEVCTFHYFYYFCILHHLYLIIFQC